MIICFYCEGFPSTTICLLILESIHCIQFLYSDSNIVLVCKLWRFSNNIMRVTEMSEPSDLHEDSKSAPILLADVIVFELWVVLLWEQATIFRKCHVDVFTLALRSEQCVFCYKATVLMKRIHCYQMSFKDVYLELKLMKLDCCPRNIDLDKQDGCRFD